jgi:serine/threonine protein kinase
VPKITDFGVARLLTCGGTVTAAGDVLGTPSFMPPEQIEGRPAEVCPASDVYALGALLYHLLTGRPPFLGKTIRDILPQVVSSDPTPPGQLVPGVSRRLEAICLRCLRKCPEDRFADAGGLADALREFRSDT